MKVNKTPIAAAVTLTLLSAAFAVQAQEQKKDDGTQLEQVVVTGIRASLQSAANIKKNASAVVDAVSAEDVGKLPDSDVGQALGRIPGISVGRAFGQGASVSIRGTDPQMTYTTLNGQTVASTGWYDQMDIDRSFNYSLLPAEMIGGMEVYKSSQANLTEGGIGGTVIVKTRKPLDLKANTVFGSVRYGDGTISDSEKEASGLYSWRNASRTFGALIAAGLSKGDYIRRGVEADSRWNSDVAPTAFVQERKRTSLNVALQARPVEGFEVGLNLLKLKLRGVLDRDDAFLVADEPRQGIQEGRLAAARAAGDEDAEPCANEAGEQLLDRRGDRTVGDQPVEVVGHRRKLADRDQRAVHRERRDDGVDPRSVGQPRIHHRARLVDAAADPRDDLVDDPEQVLLVLEFHLRRLELPLLPRHVLFAGQEHAGRGGDGDADERDAHQQLDDAEARRASAGLRYRSYEPRHSADPAGRPIRRSR